MLLSPIKKNNKTVGIVTICYKNKKEFLEKEIDKFVFYANSELLCEAIK
jgi:hypothetical protein